MDQKDQIDSIRIARVEWLNGAMLCIMYSQSNGSHFMFDENL